MWSKERGQRRVYQSRAQIEMKKIKKIKIGVSLQDRHSSY